MLDFDGLSIIQKRLSLKTIFYVCERPPVKIFLIITPRLEEMFFGNGGGDRPKLRNRTIREHLYQVYRNQTTRPEFSSCMESLSAHE